MFQKLLAEQTALREERNRLLEIKLRKMGMDVSDYLIRSESTTRVNYAAALTAAGHAENTADAFRRILNSDALADIKQNAPLRRLSSMPLRARAELQYLPTRC